MKINSKSKYILCVNLYVAFMLIVIYISNEISSINLDLAILVYVLGVLLISVVHGLFFKINRHKSHASRFIPGISKVIGFQKAKRGK